MHWPPRRGSERVALAKMDSPEFEFPDENIRVNTSATTPSLPIVAKASPKHTRMRSGTSSRGSVRRASMSFFMGSKANKPEQKSHYGTDINDYELIEVIGTTRVFNYPENRRG